ncbi:MAG: cobalamin biosynthesis protein CbiD [Dorea sp.]|nr:cobalamin biosynthesis protein CbiD [Dorea sp.]
MKSQKLRCGYTTGTCAQGATKAAMQLLFGIRKADGMDEIWVELPKGQKQRLRIWDIKIEYKDLSSIPYVVSCAVKKDAGDDPDITDGIFVYSKVTRRDEDGRGRVITVDGGEGVGRVTKPGLEQAVGEAAINRIPRQMVIKEAEKVCEEVEYEGRIDVEISIPQGEELAKRTFNPRLGVKGGLSILGTSGIVEPMSEQAIVDTVYLDMKVKLAEQNTEKKYLILSPGNYGLEFLEENYGIEETKVVKCSNFIGQSIDMAGELGCTALLFAGHIGKLIKVAGGIMNTHSAQADCRMELLAAAALRAGFSAEKASGLLDCMTVDDALSRCTKEERKSLMEQIMEKIKQYLNLRSGKEMTVEAIVFSKMYGLLGKTSHADEIAAGKLCFLSAEGKQKRGDE